MKSVTRTIQALVVIAMLCNFVVASDVESAFSKHEVVPDVLKVAPKQLLQVSFASGVTANLGNELTPTQVKDVPKVIWPAEKGAYYTLLIIDPDSPSRESPMFREFRHWMVMNIPETAVDKGDEVLGCITPFPPEDSGLHRYVFLVYKQLNGKVTHDEPRANNKELGNRANTNVIELAEKYKLGDPLFGNLYQAQYDDYCDELEEQLSI